MKNPKKKLLITGGSGLIGKFLIEQIYSDYEIFVLDFKKQILRNKLFFKKFNKVKFYYGDICDKKICKKSIRGKHYVVHLAAMLGVSNTEKNPNQCLRVNSEGTENIAKYCKIFKTKRLIFASSSEVYGEPNLNPIKETFKLNGKSIYAISKIIGEKIIQDLCFKNNYKIFIFFNTIGESQVGQFVVPKFIKNFKENKNIIINGNGKQIRGYAHAQDIAQGIKLTLKNKKTFNKIYNLGNSSECFSLKELANKILRLNNKSKTKVIYNKAFLNTDRTKNREINFRYCCTSKAKKDFNFKCRINLDSALSRIYKQKKIYSFW